MKTGLPIQSDAGDVALHITRSRARVPRARNGVFVGLCHLRHRIGKILRHRHSVCQAYRQIEMGNKRKLLPMGVGLLNPPSFSIIDRAGPTRTRVHNSHRGVGIDIFARAFGG